MRQLLWAWTTLVPIVEGGSNRERGDLAGRLFCPGLLESSPPLGGAGTCPCSRCCLKELPKDIFFFFFCFPFSRWLIFPGRLFCLQPLSLKSFQLITSTENGMSLLGPSRQRLQVGCAFLVPVALFCVVGFGGAAGIRHDAWRCSRDYRPGLGIPKSVPE